MWFSVVMLVYQRVEALTMILDTQCHKSTIWRWLTMVCKFVTPMKKRLWRWFMTMKYAYITYIYIYNNDKQMMIYVVGILWTLPHRTIFFLHCGFKEKHFLIQVVRGGPKPQVLKDTPSHWHLIYQTSPWMWVNQCHFYHPPVITILIGGMLTISQSWVVYFPLFYQHYSLL